MRIWPRPLGLSSFRYSFKVWRWGRRAGKTLGMMVAAIEGHGGMPSSTAPATTRRVSPPPSSSSGISRKCPGANDVERWRSSAHQAITTAPGLGSGGLRRIETRCCRESRCWSTLSTAPTPLVDHWGTALHPTNSLGPMQWNVNGSAELLEIANRSFDEFGIPRWAEMGGGEARRRERSAHCTPSHLRSP